MSEIVNRIGVGLAAAAFVVPTIEAAPAGAELEVAPKLAQGVGQAAVHPNVVVFLMDDLSKDIMPYMPNERRLIRDRGMSFKRAYVEQSTCCPSRATIYSGLYAHNHGVIGNDAPMGGYSRYAALDEGHDLPNWLAANPDLANKERTLMGKTFNDYPLRGGIGHVILGWNDFLAPAGGQPYDQRGYTLNYNGAVTPNKSNVFLDEVLGSHMLAKISEDGGQNWREGGNLVFDASYAPHTPYAYEHQYGHKFNNIHYPRTPAFQEKDTSDKFGSAAEKPALDAQKIAEADQIYRKRVRAVQTEDKIIAETVAAVEAAGAMDNTYFVFMSDNGYHDWDHHLTPGKYTEYEMDVNIPLDISGPGIRPGTSSNAIVGNVDIASTVLDMMNANQPTGVSMDGTSILPIAEGKQKSVRNYYLLGRGKVPLNHNGIHNTREPAEAEVDTRRSAMLNDFVGVVGERYKYVHFSHHGSRRQEFFDLKKDPNELNNLLTTQKKLTRKERVELHRARRALAELENCAGDDCIQ
jgi:N-acetylglucosamine-6-sulfatase